jgi:hypothetical protein
MSDAIIGELQARASFLQSQSVVMSSAAGLQETQVGALIAIIQGSGRSLTIADATSITNAIQHGPWTPQQKTALASAAADQLRAAGATPSSAVRAQQYYDNFAALLDEPTVATLQDPSLSANDKLTTLGKFCNACGITCPSERLQFAMTAVVVVCHFGQCTAATLSPSEKYAFAKRLQQRVKRVDKAPAVKGDHLVHVPVPLPPLRAAYVYGNGGVPLT